MSHGCLHRLLPYCLYEMRIKTGVVFLRNSFSPKSNLVWKSLDEHYLCINRNNIGNIECIVRPLHTVVKRVMNKHQLIMQILNICQKYSKNNVENKTDIPTSIAQCSMCNRKSLRGTHIDSCKTMSVSIGVTHIWYL